MKACIVRPHNAGLFSLINNVITCLGLYDYVHVDWSEGCLYGNAWPELFEPNEHPSRVANVTSIELIREYPHQALTYKNAGLLYLAQDLLGWRKNVHRYWQRLTVQPAILERVKAIQEANLADGYISVLVRSNIHAGEQIHGIAQTREQYRNAMARYPAAKFYVATADEESLKWFDGFNVVSHPFVRRGKTRDNQFHLEEPQTIVDAIDCLMEVLILSQGNALIHPVSNMATAALYMEPDLFSVYLP